MMYKLDATQRDDDIDAGARVAWNGKGGFIKRFGIRQDLS